MDLPQDRVEEFLSRIDIGGQESPSLRRGVTVFGKPTPSEWRGRWNSKSEGLSRDSARAGLLAFVSLVG